MRSSLRRAIAFAASRMPRAPSRGGTLSLKTRRRAPRSGRVPPGPQPLIYYDLLMDAHIHGWAMVSAEEGGRDAAEPDQCVELRLGDTVIGRRRRRIVRADVDAAKGQPHVTKGFDIPAMAAAAFSALLGGSMNVSFSFAGMESLLSDLPGHLSDMSTFRSLRLCDGGPLRIVDLWFATDSELRIRVEDAAVPCTLRFYQPEFGPTAGLALVGEQAVAGPGIAFVGVPLANPLLPLLVTVSDESGETPAMDIVPFPSLCRGGLHDAERRALAVIGNYLGDLRAISDSFVRELVGWPDAPEALSVARIHVDLSAASGAERIFSVDVLEWLTRLMGVAVALRDGAEAAAGPDDTLVDSLRRRLAQAEVAERHRRGGGATLVLPADAVPTISALVSRRLARLAAPGGVSCPFAVAPLAGTEPTWLVSLPALPGWLQELQPPVAPLPYPILEPAGDVGAAEVRSGASGLPMGIRFVDTAAFRNEELRVFPVAPDHGGPLLRRTLPAERRRGVTVSVLVSVRNGVPMLAALLESLRAQTLADALEVVVVDNRSWSTSAEEIAATAREMFGDRCTILPYDAPFNHSAQANLAAEAAKGDFLLIANSDVVLHDSRTLETLCVMADHDRVASAGCMLIHEKGEKAAIKFRSAGVFPSELSFIGQPHAAFAEANCEGVLALATYPVVANSFALAMARADVWKRLGGLDAAAFPTDYNDIDYGVRALQQGLVSLCTTAVSAYHPGRASRGSSFDVHAARHFLAPGMETLFSNCTILQRLT